MEPENHSPVPEATPAEEPAADTSLLPEDASAPSPAPGPNANPDPEEYRGVDWVFIGDQGLRAGWSVLIFVPIYFIALSRWEPRHLDRWKHRPQQAGQRNCSFGGRR